MNTFLILKDYFQYLSPYNLDRAGEVTMAEPNKSNLMKNAIIRREENNELRCFICPTDSIVKNREEHIEKRQHLEALEQFELIFSNDDGKIRCKLCDADLCWKNIRTHGKSHRIMPWYEPEEKFKNCLENRIIAFETRFYCCSCEMFFPEWSAAFAHSTDPRHRDLHERLPSLEDILPLSIDIDHEILVREALVLFDRNSLICKACNDEIVELANILGHVDSFLHIYRLDTKKNTLLERENVFPTVKDKREAKTLEKKHHSELFCDYVEKVDHLYSRCVICEKQFFTERTKDHSNEEGHAEALKRFGCEYVTPRKKTGYHCSCCNCTIPGIANLQPHVKGRRHASAILKNLNAVTIRKDGSAELEKVADNCRASVKTSGKCRKSKKKSKTLDMEKKTEKMVNTGETEDPKPLRVKNEPGEVQFEDKAKKISDNYCIRKRAPTDWFCKICSVHFPDRREIEAHTMNTEHEISMKKYGCESIELLEPNVYRCRCCVCKIPGVQNVSEHVMGKRHSTCMATGSKADKLQRDENVVKSKPESSKIMSTAITTELSKLYLHLRAKSGKGGKKRKRIVNNFDKNIPTMRNISCHICRLEVADSADFHSHLANHLSVDFVDRKIDENANLRCPSLTREASALSKNGGDTISSILANDDNNRTEIEYPPPIDFGHDASDSEDDADSVMKTEYLGSGKNFIYDMKEKLRIVQLGTRLSLIGDEKTIYCLVCRKTVANKLQSYFEHLSSLGHTINMVGMEEDDSLFDEAVGQFSELQLALEYMEERSNQLVRCLVCDENVIDEDERLQRHIREGAHRRRHEETSASSRISFDRLKARMRCDWYYVQKYWCVPCSTNYPSEEEFSKHLDNPRHGFSIEEISLPDKKKLIYDFCPTCGLLWYGYRTTYAYHCGLLSHKWLSRDGHYSPLELPQLARVLLADAETYVDDALSKLKESSRKTREKESSLMQQLVKTVEKKFETVKAYKFGSRVCGVASDESAIDIFLDRGDMYEGKLESKNGTKEFISSVQECLSDEPLSWDTEVPKKKHGVSILHAHHKPTGISCDIFFENGLPVETSNLLKSINEKFPLCRQMIIFLKQWLMLCDLSGHDRISNYAIYWYVVFYLQQESILPSINTLLAMKKTPRFIAGWKVSVSHNFAYNEAERDFSLKELLTGFFKYYANFDFRYDVACPLTGQVTKKRLFADLKLLPEEMGTYVTYMKSSRRREPFNIGCPMCIQDPFDLRANLTKNVTKVYLSRFRNYCFKSLDTLCPS